MTKILDGKEVVLENVLAGIVPTTSGWGIAPIGYAFADDGGSFTNETTDANSAGAADVLLLPAVPVAGDAFYFGMDKMFAIITINISTLGAGNTLVWEYWNGTWTALSGLTDNTNNFGTAGAALTVTYTLPSSDWATTTVNSQSAYWIRARLSVAGATAVATQIWLDGTPYNLANATDNDTTTATDIGAMVVTTGDFRFNLGSAKTGIIIVKLGVWCDTGTINISLDTSSDGSTYFNNSSRIASTTNTTESIIDCLLGTIVNRQYFRIRTVGAASQVGKCRLYDVRFYQL